MFKKLKKIASSKTFLISFSIVACVVMVGGAYVYKTKAEATMGPYGMYLIGGKIEEIEYCCNGLKLTIGDPRGGDYMFTPGLSSLYKWWNISNDKCLLGDAYPFGVCIKPASWPPCSDEEEVDGTIRQIGTTLEDPEQGMCEGQFSGGGGNYGGGGADGGY
jgi:uncharacterized membrane protein YgcG